MTLRLGEQGDLVRYDGRVIPGARQGEHGPDAGSFNVEDIFNPDTDKADNRKLKVSCPSCERVNCPWLSPYLRHVYSGWRWVGLDHQEPYSEWTCRCRCGQWYDFKTYVPQ